jgi:LPPG:FO 2-phospho-L-lactate transferase
VSAVGVGRLYAGILDRYVLDATDAALVPRVEELGMTAVTAPTVMHTDADRAGLARFLLEAAAR